MSISKTEVSRPTPTDAARKWLMANYPNHIVSGADGYQYSVSLMDLPKVMTEFSATGRAEMLDALKQADLQIEYMQAKFTETGTGNSVRAQIQTAIRKAEGGL